MRRRAKLTAAVLMCVACAGNQTVPPIGGDPPLISPPAPLSFPVYEATIPEMQDAMASGRTTSQELVRAYLRRIEAYDQQGPLLNTMIRLNHSALDDAAALDAERAAKGPRGMLHGIPVLLKDNYDTRSLPTTAGSLSLAGAQPATDATVVRRLREAGAVLLGKTNMMEFALGVYTVSSLTGATRNPYDPSRSPGGSSGGSAAAVAASLAAVAWGTDTCGSLRVPAAFNALFALRPTKGISSVAGIIPLSHSMDVSGLLARTSTDLAIGLDVTVALDVGDEASGQWRGQQVPRFVPALDSTALRGARLGVLKEFFGTGPGETETSDSVHAALAEMVAAGATIVEVSIPGLDSLSAKGNVVPFEFREDLNAYLGQHPATPVRTLQDIIVSGLFVDLLKDDLVAFQANPGLGSPRYAQAVQRRRELRRELTSQFDNFKLDALVYPTVRRGPNLVGVPQTDPNCEASANAGFPALSIPVAYAADGLPIGMELMGAPLADAKLLSLGYSWELLASPRRPPLYAPPVGLRGAPPPAPVRVTVARDSLTVITELIFDAPTGTVEWSVEARGIAAEDMLAVSLHESPLDSEDGPAVTVLARPGQLTSSGRKILGMPERLALHEGRLYVTVLTSAFQHGELRARVPVPAGPVVRS